jgi:hypothetical protein
VDENAGAVFYRDADGDGYGSSGNATQACTAPAGYVIQFGDCNDSDATVNPGAPETCNGVDDDCDGDVDENAGPVFHRDGDGDGYGNRANPTQACSAPSGYVGNAGDCNDSNATVHPGATETCNGGDDDCDGSVDEGAGPTFYRDGDGDQYGDSAISTQACAAPAGYVANSSDCNDSSAAVFPGATETCNGSDDDCDGTIDEGVRSTFYRDADGDGTGDATNSTEACTAPVGYVASATDCDDSSTAVNPGATEACNSVDDDCDGTVDEGCP